MQESKTTTPDNTAPQAPENLTAELRSIVDQSVRNVDEATQAPPKKRGGARPGAGRPKKNQTEVNQNAMGSGSDSGLGGDHVDSGGGAPGFDSPGNQENLSGRRVHLGSRAFETLARCGHKIAALKTGDPGLSLEPELAHEIGQVGEAAGRDWLPAIESRWASLLLFVLVAGSIVLIKVLDHLERAAASSARPSAPPPADRKPGAEPAPQRPPADAASPALLPYRPFQTVGKRPG